VVKFVWKKILPFIFNLPHVKGQCHQAQLRQSVKHENGTQSMRLNERQHVVTMDSNMRQTYC